MNSKLINTLIIIIASSSLYLVFYHSNIILNNKVVMASIILAISTCCLIFINVKQQVLRNSLITVFAMAGFGFVLVPIYNVFCDITGLNGKVDLSIQAALADGIELDREVIVEFVVSHNERMPWRFEPKHIKMTAHPGELMKTAYFAKNNTDKTMIAQAIPSISPAKASKHFKKVKCFCFSQQRLGPQESQYFTLHYYVDKKLPKDVKRITLSYTLFDITKDVKSS